VDTFSIAFVCTGNRFRSPLAEAFVRRLTLELPVSVDSYGTLELENAPPLPEAAEIALSCGISLADHRTRYLNNASLEDVDLLLGFEPAHIRQAVVDGQAPRERSFTMRDFVPLLPTAGLAARGSRQASPLAGRRSRRAPGRIAESDDERHAGPVRRSMEGVPTDGVRHPRPFSHPGRKAVRGC